MKLNNVEQNAIDRVLAEMHRHYTHACTSRNHATLEAQRAPEDSMGKAAAEDERERFTLEARALKAAMILVRNVIK